MTQDGSGESDLARRRLRGFLFHLVGYFVVIVGLVAVSLIVDAEKPWYVWPMVGWGGVLAFHAAHAMGLFGTGAS